LGITISLLQVISKKLFIKNYDEFYGTAEEVIALLIKPSLRKI